MEEYNEDEERELADLMASGWGRPLSDPLPDIPGVESAAGQCHPGELLWDEIEARGWSRGYLAERARLKLDVVWELLRGQRDFDEPLAHAIQNATGISSSYWLTLQAAWNKREKTPQPTP